MNKLSLKQGIALIGLFIPLLVAQGYSAYVTVENHNELFTKGSSSYQKSDIRVNYDSKMGEKINELFRLDALSGKIIKHQKLLIDKESEITESIIHQDYDKLKMDLSERNHLENKFKELVDELNK